MKNFVYLFIASFLLLGCNQDKENDNGLMEYYENSPSLDDGLIAKYTADDYSTVYLYGSSDENGKGNDLKSVAYKKADNDTLINIIFDDLDRPKLTYLSTTSGFKSNFIVKLDYEESNDSIVVNHYKYNWETETDSLFASYKFKGQNGVVYYGNKTTNKNDAEFVAAWGAIIIIGVFCPIAGGYAVANLIGWGTFIGNVAGAFTIVGLASSIWTNNVANASALTSIPISPSSPTNGTIPNPTGTPSNPSGSTTVTDLDGNVYHTIQIGDQIWMLENLRTTKYRNGSPIPFLNNFNDWQQAVYTAAYCYSEFSSQNLTNNGLIYNSYAAMNPNIAPEGWHVPTRFDWAELFMHLGATEQSYLDYYYYDGDVSNELGSISSSPYTTNSSGFSANDVLSTLSGNWYGNDSTFGRFWTSTYENNKLRLVCMYGDPGNKNVYIFAGYSLLANPGYSIRCVKD